MKYTLLEMVQNILASLNEDEVNSIGDTPEASQVSEIIRETYNNILSLQEWKHLQKSFKLDASGSLLLPTKMTTPEDITNINWIKYKNKSDTFIELVHLTPEEFVEKTIMYTDNIIEMVDGDTTLNIRTDKEPEFWTTFDDTVIYFDSYDISRQSTMMSDDTFCYGTKSPVFSLEDNFIPNLPADAFSYLLSEAKSIAFVEISQQVNSKAEQSSRRGRYRMNYADGNFKRTRSIPNYGRK
jgi:hypothetical protein